MYKQFSKVIFKPITTAYIVDLFSTNRQAIDSVLVRHTHTPVSYRHSCTRSSIGRSALIHSHPGNESQFCGLANRRPSSLRTPTHNPIHPFSAMNITRARKLFNAFSPCASVSVGPRERAKVCTPVVSGGTLSVCLVWRWCDAKGQGVGDICSRAHPARFADATRRGAFRASCAVSAGWEWYINFTTITAGNISGTYITIIIGAWDAYARLMRACVSVVVGVISSVWQCRSDVGVCDQFTLTLTPQSSLWYEVVWIKHYLMLLLSLLDVNQRERETGKGRGGWNEKVYAHAEHFKQNHITWFFNFPL